MARKDDHTPEQSEIPDDNRLRLKMNGRMRRLLATSDREIMRRVRAEQKQIKEIRELRFKEIKKTPAEATREEMEFQRKAVAEKIPFKPDSLITPVIPFFRYPIKIRALTRFAGNRDDLENMGIKVRSQAQDIFTVVGTKQQLQDLVAMPACHSLRTPRTFGSTVENATAQSEVADIHNPRPANPNGYQGDGVLIGVIDSPLDVTHHGFREPAGVHDSRVLYYWAQSAYTRDLGGNPIPQAGAPGDTPEDFTTGSPVGTVPNFIGLDYGRLYDNGAINTAIGLVNPYGTGNNQICCEPNNAEHGTHCAGIAAGSGHENTWATAPTHIGAAPQAAMVHVALQLLSWESDIGGTFEDALLDAIDFCYRAADFHNMPIVISVSQGGSTGPHNGETDFDIARDNFLNSFDDRAMVWAAGNDNNDQGYRTGTIAGGNTVESFTFTKDQNAGRWLEIWYNGPELDYRIVFGGDSSGWRTAGQDYNGTVNGQDIVVDRDGEPVSGLQSISMYFEDSNVGDTFTIRLRNPHASQQANYHAWAGLQGGHASLSGSTQDDMTLSDTGCGKSILTVGATRKVLPANPATGELITDYSAAGPTLDGRIKPEIVAGGGDGAINRIISANSNLNSGYVGKSGTSMATPLVAGAAALMFEAYGDQGFTLNQDTIKALMIQHADRQNLHLDPAQPDYVETERNLYGYGRLRMIGPIDHVLPPLDVDLWIRTAADDYGDQPYPGGCFCGAPDIRVCEQGTNNATTHISWGTTYDVKVRVRNLGDSDAVDATVRLKYTLPHTSPDSWFEAEDSSNNKLVQTVTVPAMDDVDLVFSWRPQAAEIGAPAGATHFCMLAEVDHTQDPLTYPAPTTAGGNAWSTNIKSTNNVALRNLHIQ